MTVALLFPGQGAQYVGMGMDLAEAHPIARDILTEADDVLGMALSDIIANGPDADLTRTDISQPAILTVSWMACSVLQKSCNPLCFAMTAGLSLGEYTALLAAGAMDFADALRLVRLRGEAMQAAAEAVSSGMVALVGADEPAADALCAAARAEDEILTVANLNSPGQVVISGHASACTRAVELAREHGIRRATPLKVAGAFHSPLMAPAAERLHAALAAVAFREPTVPVFSNVTGLPVTDAAAIPELLVQQLTSPVRWQACMEAMAASGGDRFIELGPGKALTGMLTRCVREARGCKVEDSQDVLAAVQSLRD